MELQPKTSFRSQSVNAVSRLNSVKSNYSDSYTPGLETPPSPSQSSISFATKLKIFIDFIDWFVSVSGYLSRHEDPHQYLFYVFTPDLQLFAFSSSVHDTAPLDVLAVTSCVGLFSPIVNAYVLRFQGPSSAWKMLCYEEDTLHMWTSVVNKALDESEALVAATSATTTSSTRSRDQKIAPAGEISEERKAQMKKMHELYVQSQTNEWERKRAAYLVKKEEFDRIREQEERERMLENEARSSSEEQMKREKIKRKKDDIYFHGGIMAVQKYNVFMMLASGALTLGKL
ncbi:hypothetical protein HK100_001925 [Physocladia obscura]|uniref:Uncharacterized protein n=1 Tax=Physocladia obscura TaxID=109957 RepID=A0AAD5XAP2_9FUNG|nr:hypothetical protein HK100_001925 [Physocladia obscura]